MIHSPGIQNIQKHFIIVDRPAMFIIPILIADSAGMFAMHMADKSVVPARAVFTMLTGERLGPRMRFDMSAHDMHVSERPAAYRTHIVSRIVLLRGVLA